MKPLTHRSFERSPSDQRGAVLFIALIMLVLITLLALAASSSSILQEKMVGGLRNQQLSAMGADSALRGTESWLWNLNFSAIAGHPLPHCIGSGSGTCVHSTERDGTLKPMVQAFRTSKSWVNPPAGAPGYVHTLTGLSGPLETASLARQPEVMIEDMGPNLPPSSGTQRGIIDPAQQTADNFYRITVRSEGGSSSSIRVLESIFSSSNFSTSGTE